MELTIDPKVQRAAWDALGDQRGAVVALDPNTGAVLAMVSKPSYDPNQLATHSPVPAAQKAYERLLAAANKPLSNRAIAGDLYRRVDLQAHRHGCGPLQRQVPRGHPAVGAGVLDLPQSTAVLPNDDRQPCGPNNQVSLADALRISCNTALGISVWRSARRRWRTRRRSSVSAVRCRSRLR